MAKQTIEQLTEHLKELNSQAGSPLFPSPPTMDKEKILTAPDILESSDYTFSSNTRVFIREQK